MSHSSIDYLAGSALAVLAILVAFLIYAVIRYAPIIARIFEEKPLFFPLRLTAQEGGEEVTFQTPDGLTLAGTYYRSPTRSRAGVIVFCHEYLSDRWSYHPYADPFRRLGFDVFTFDFRNHGNSAYDPIYRPLQWLTDHEVNDLTAALDYLRSRPDRDPAGFGLFGVSRGGSAALVAAARDTSVWGVVTDGAFPTRGMVLAYMLRWAEIYVSRLLMRRVIPLCVVRFIGWTGMVLSGRRLNCRFPDVEQAVGKIAPRPWLMIHGEKDAYIVPAIARALFAQAGEPKELWLVPTAKHNRCREVAPEAYAERVASFFQRWVPAREPSLAVAPAADTNGIDSEAKAARVDTERPAVLSGRLAAQV